MRFVPHMPGAARERHVVVWGRPRGLRLAAVISGIVFCVLASALLAVRYTWPDPAIGPGGLALARVDLARFGERVTTVTVVDRGGAPIAVALRGDAIVPTLRVRPAKRLQIEVTVRRAGWLGWLVGGSKQLSATTRTPASYVAATIVRPDPGGPVRIRFSSPVAAVSVDTPEAPRRLITFARPRRNVPIGLVAAGATTAGTVLVAGAPRTWERPPAPVRVNWFPAGAPTQALVRPAPATRIGPAQPLVLTFSRPVADVLGGKPPRLWPEAAGTWRQPNPHMLVFQPSGTGFTLGSWVHVDLPLGVQVAGDAVSNGHRTLAWHVPPASPVRLQQLLAQLGYLPVAFHADTAVSNTPAAEATAAIAPPTGKFSWRFKTTPKALKGLWTSSDDRATMLRGALMAFESTHELTVDGQPDRLVWDALLGDELKGKRAPYGYSYVFVSESIPQTLTLWQGGKVVLRTPVNTGIASRPTALGTYPVYMHLASTTMAGTNPDGTHYNDAGVPWVNYFNGGDAVHGFVRGGYGWPQSLGCVEVPISTAALIFPHVQIGTLVTVDS
jgi:L,D-transpeptidase catalytic domain